MNVDRYSQEFETLTFSNPADGVLQITMEGPGSTRSIRASTGSSPTCGPQSTVT